jgi:hypothetical protein
MDIHVISTVEGAAQAGKAQGADEIIAARTSHFLFMVTPPERN